MLVVQSLHTRQISALVRGDCSSKQCEENARMERRDVFFSREGRPTWLGQDRNKGMSLLFAGFQGRFATMLASESTGTEAVSHSPFCLHFDWCLCKVPSLPRLIILHAASKRTTARPIDSDTTRRPNL